ncbi:MAG: hypothetical protein IKW90_13480 [Lachnospiraceae bacterium]|nr:hypothetical protein [Lachnospiraceae bacterium]
MQVHLNEEELQKEMELEAYDKIKQEELEVKRENDKANRKKADKRFQIIVFSIIGLILLAVLMKWLFMTPTV